MTFILAHVALWAFLFAVGVLLLILSMLVGIDTLDLGGGISGVLGICGLVLLAAGGIPLIMLFLRAALLLLIG